jgi:hypothetical protein
LSVWSNAGAEIVLITVVGHIGPEGSHRILVIRAAYCFRAGIAFSGLAHGTSYPINLALYNEHTFPEICHPEQQWIMRHDFCLWFSILLFFMAVAFFGARRMSAVYGLVIIE